MTAHRSIGDAVAITPHSDGRTVEVRLAHWMNPAKVSDGRVTFTEQFASNSITVIPDAPVYRERPRTGNPHLDQPMLVGRIEGYRSAPDGCYATVRIADSVDGRDLLALVDEKVIRHVSIEFDSPALATAGRATGVVTHTQAIVAGLLFTQNPQVPGADVVGRRANQGDPAMPDTDTTTPTIDPVPAPAAAAAAPAPVTDPNPAAPGLRAVPGVGSLGNLPADAANQLPAGFRAEIRACDAAASRFGSFGEFAHAASIGRSRISTEESDLVYRALAQASTADTTGLIQTQWIFDVIDLVRKYTPIIEAFDQAPLPEKGLTVARPKVTQRPTTAKQAAQGAALSSQKVIIAPVNYSVDPYGGGQEMSLSTMQRTEPAYLDQVLRLYGVEAARNLETAVGAALVTASTAVNASIEMANTAADIQIAFTAACVPFLNNLDRLPEFALINVPLWQRMVNAVDSQGRALYPTLSPFNPSGTIAMTTPEGQIRDLRFRVAPKLGVAAGPGGRAIVGVPEAWVSMLGGLQTLQADVPETLIHQMSVFQFASFGVTDAAGLQLITDAV
jgi:hypothetical protein